MSRKKGFGLTGKELALAVILAFLGFVFSMRTWLLFLNGLSPFEGLLVYYVILYVSLFLLSKAGLVVFGLKIDDAVQTLGLLMVTFAFFIVVGFSSAYTQFVTMGNLNGASTVFLQCEDGSVWFVWSWLLPWADIFVLRILTYVMTPLALSLIGGILVSGKIKLQ